MSLLRELTNPEDFQANPAEALIEAALIVRRAGLEHLVTDATEPEVMAMVTAGERIVLERAAVFSRAIREPEAAWGVMDNGEGFRRKTLRLALQKARESRGGS